MKDVLKIMGGIVGAVIALSLIGGIGTLILWILVATF